mmetsp:Transcript_2949/g.8642  ORF Transcript_2949/g.8642 Transcript_2949/m.8642 type:complete len:132 (-) Transcript_2949:880-1275(-)
MTPGSQRMVTRRQSQAAHKDAGPAEPQDQREAALASPSVSAPQDLKEGLDGEVVHLFYDKPVGLLGRIKKELHMVYTNYYYTFVFNCMDWWERIMMHSMLLGAVLLVVWGVLHQGSYAAHYARQLLTIWST